MFINFSVNSLNMKMRLLIHRLMRLIHKVEDQGFITTLNLVGSGATAAASATLAPNQSGFLKFTYSFK